MIDDVLELVLELLGEMMDLDGRIGRWFAGRREQFGKWRARRRMRDEHGKE